jgi:hypothetical protein
VIVTRTQLLILIGLGIAIVALFVGAYFLVLQPRASRTPAATLPLATVPPNPLLMTRAPLCRDAVRSSLSALGLPGEGSLDPQASALEIRLTRPSAAVEGEVPAGEIWSAFEAALAARAEGCDGYGTLVVLVGGFRAQVGVEHLLAWEAGSIDDGTLSTRVELTR